MTRPVPAAMHDQIVSNLHAKVEKLTAERDYFQKEAERAEQSKSEWHQQNKQTVELLKATTERAETAQREWREANERREKADRETTRLRGQLEMLERLGTIPPEPEPKPIESKWDDVNGVWR